MNRTVPKWLALILFIPYIVLLGPFIALGIGIIFINATISGLYHRTSWLRGLRRKRRAATEAEMLNTAASGTLIVDRAGFNFKRTHCWWTKENVLAVSPVPIPTDDERLELLHQTKESTVHEFDGWCWDRYISPDTGSAILVTPPHHGEEMAKRIRENKPGLECVKSWSAIIAMQSMARNATKKGDDREPEEAG